MMTVFFVLFFASVSGSPQMEAARDAQDRAALERAVAQFSAQAQKQPSNADAQYRLALAQSMLAEVALELRDKNQAKTAAEDGIKAAEKAVSLNGSVAEYHRVLGTLCGQVIPANTWLAMKYGRCALESINQAIQLDSRSALAYVSRGVGNYYLPPALGGSIDKALQDFQKAAQIDPKLPDPHLWMGVALRKANRNAEARTEFQRALTLNPRRIWAKQQLEKTPAQ